MPRKANGFGTQNVSFKSFSTANKKGTSAAGFYPSDRKFGSTVHRSVIEKWDIDSKWAKWRKGTTIYSYTYWSKLMTKNLSYDPGSARGGTNVPYVPSSIASSLFTGASYSYDLKFSGYEFPTMNSDDNTYYTVKREPQYTPLGTVNTVENEIYNLDGTYTSNYQSNQIRLTINPNPTYSRLLLSLIGDRITDGDNSTVNRTEATLTKVLTADNKPGIYDGLTLSKELAKTSKFNHELTKITVTIPVSDVNVTVNSGSFVPNQGINSTPVDITTSSLDILNNPALLIGNIIHIQDFFKDKPISDLDSHAWSSPTTDDEVKYVQFSFEENEVAQTITGLEKGVNNLPPSMLDLATLPTIFTTTNAAYKIEGSYVFDKSRYQPLFGKTYLTSDVIESQVNDISYSVLPFEISKAAIINGKFVIEAVPFLSSIKLYPVLGDGTILIYDASSFMISNPRGERTYLDLDVDPFIDEIFTSGLDLRPAILFSCSCPSYAKAKLAMPQSSQTDDQRKTNRQSQYPLPTCQGPSTFESTGSSSAAGKMATWGSASSKLEFRFCKHTIAAMNIEGYTVKEPSNYPSSDTRLKFDEKLEEDMEKAVTAYNNSYKRAGIGLSEVVFSLAQGMNLDDTETAYVVLNSTQR